MTTTTSLQSFKDSLLLTGDLGLEDQVEAVQFLEKRLEESRKLAVKKCEDLKRALIIKTESDGEPPEKKKRFDPSIEFNEENGGNEKNIRESDTKKTAEISAGSRKTSDSYNQLVILKRDPENALKNVKTKEVEAEQLRKAVAVNDAEMKTKEHQLTEALDTMTAEKRQLEEKLAGQTKELKAVKQQMNWAQQETRKKSTELCLKVKELQAAKVQAKSARNGHSSLQRQMNELEKSRNNLEHENLSNISKHEREISRVKKEALAEISRVNKEALAEISRVKKEALAEEIKAFGYNIVKVRNDLEVALTAVKNKEAEGEQLKKAVVVKDNELAKVRSTVIQLKKIVRNFRERAELAEKTVNDLTVEKEEILVKLSEVKGEGNPEGSDSMNYEMNCFLETNQNGSTELEVQNEESKKEKEDIPESFDANENKEKEDIPECFDANENKEKEDIAESFDVNDNKEKEDIPESFDANENKEKEDIPESFDANKNKEKEDIPERFDANENKEKEDIPESFDANENKEKEDIPESFDANEIKEKEDIPESFDANENKEKEDISESFDANENNAKNVCKNAGANTIKIEEGKKELSQQPFGSVSNELAEAQGLVKAQQSRLSEL